MSTKAMVRTVPWEAPRVVAAPVLAGGLLVALAAVLYRSVLPAWLAALWSDPNYSHGLLVPFISLWLAWQRRAELASLTPRPASSAVVLIAGAIGLLAAGLLAAELFVTRFSMLLLLTGLLAFVLGYAYIRALALPLAFLLFMIPLPALLFNAVAFPLQILASQIAVAVLRAAEVPALREGNVILLPNVALEVVEACSGLRSLVSLAATSVVVAVLLLRSNILRLLLLAMSVPIAVVTNGARVAGTGVLAYLYGAKVAEGFFHGFSGWIVFLTALLCLAGVAAALRRLDRV